MDEIKKKYFLSRGFKFVQMKGPALFEEEIFTKQRKFIDEI